MIRVVALVFASSLWIGCGGSPPPSDDHAPPPPPTDRSSPKHPLKISGDCSATLSGTLNGAAKDCYYLAGVDFNRKTNESSFFVLGGGDVDSAAGPVRIWYLGGNAEFVGEPTAKTFRTGDAGVSAGVFIGIEHGTDPQTWKTSDYTLTLSNVNQYAEDDAKKYFVMHGTLDATIHSVDAPDKPVQVHYTFASDLIPSS
jgi:hypothetical protein